MAESNAEILIIEDDVDVAHAAQLLLRRRGYAHVRLLSKPAGLAAALAEGVPDVVLLDLNFSAGRIDGGEGLALLGTLRALPRPPAVIAITAYADVPLAVEALKRGASDFITKPWNNRRLAAAVDTELSRRAHGAVSAITAGMLTGTSAAMAEIKKIIDRVGPTEANVLILGENGVGKELVARSIHQNSARAASLMLAVDVGALPESTFESELFGHRKGAFTDASRDRLGRFQAARGGTLFLDEIGNVSLAGQAKLLAALERREVTPVGADHAEPIDVRVISATNLSEEALYDPARLRPDLLFRLNTIVIRVPSLRERATDIPLLVTHFLALYEEKYQQGGRAVSAAALDALCRYAWPGNVRELRHACERAVIMCDSADYTLDDFRLGRPVPALASACTETLQLDALERRAIARALEQTGGQVTEAAALLGLSRSALYRKLGKHGKLGA